MYHQNRDLDVWEEVIEKAVNAEAKADLESPLETKEINSRFPKYYWPSIKKDKKHKATRDDKTKFHNFPANTSQL